MTAPALDPDLSKTRLWSLDRLRVGATFFVVYGHFAQSFELTKFPFNIWYIAAFAMSAFFMLSGFMWVWASDGRRSPIHRVIRRIGRFYPLYLVMIVLIFVWDGRHGDPFGKLELLAGLTLTQAWFPRTDVHYGIDFVYWYLSAEAAFAVAGAILEPRTRNWKVRSYAIGIVGCAVAMGVYTFFAIRSDANADWTLWVFPPYRFPAYLAGLFLAQWYRAHPIRTVPLSRAWGLLGVSTFIGAFVGLTWAQVIVFVPMVVVILASAQRDVREQRSSPGYLVMLFGPIAFAMYMSHLLTMRARLEVMWRLFDLGVHSDERPAIVLTAFFLLEFVFIIPVAIVLHYLVERPAAGPVDRLAAWISGHIDRRLPSRATSDA